MSAHDLVESIQLHEVGNLDSPRQVRTASRLVDKALTEHPEWWAEVEALADEPGEAGQYAKLIDVANKIRYDYGAGVSSEVWQLITDILIGKFEDELDERPRTSRR